MNPRPPSLSERARARTILDENVDRAVAESVLAVWRDLNERALAAQATLSRDEIRRRANAPGLADEDHDGRVAAVLATLPTAELELWVAMVDMFARLIDDQAEHDDPADLSLEERVAELEALVAGAGAVLRQAGR